REAVHALCGPAYGDVRPNGMGFRYDAQGDAIAEYDFTMLSAAACYDGTPHVFVRTYALPKEVEPYGRLPAWLRAFLIDHPSPGVSLIPAGREEAVRKEFERLPRVAPPLPRDSG